VKFRPREIWLISFAVVALTLGSIVVFVAATGVGPGQSLKVANCLPRDPVSTRVQVALNDGGAMMGGSSVMVSMSADTTSVPAGAVTFVASNFGRLNHELLILPMTADGPGTRPVGADGKIDESSGLGEASRSCASGVGDGIAPGVRSWVTVKLAPGTYELLCDVAWHYADGMFTTFTVH
jgi:uncharacterized cupredoxin-like copper-binding protein